MTRRQLKQHLIRLEAEVEQINRQEADDTVSAGQLWLAAVMLAAAIAAALAIS